MNYTIKNYLNSFRTAFGKTIESIEDMGRIYNDAITHYPETARKEFAKEYPQVRENTWETLELIGKGKLSAKAFFLRASIRNELAENVPLATQEKIFKGDNPQFKVVVPSTKQVAVVGLAELDKEQFKILFDKDEGRVRSVGEQKVLIENFHKTAAKKPAKSGKYEIVGKRAVIGGIRFSLDELKEVYDALYEAVYGE